VSTQDRFAHFDHDWQGDVVAELRRLAKDHGLPPPDVTNECVCLDVRGARWRFWGDCDSRLGYVVAFCSEVQYKSERDWDEADHPDSIELALALALEEVANRSRQGERKILLHEMARDALAKHGSEDER
jgi:hypothetical protein